MTDHYYKGRFQSSLSLLACLILASHPTFLHFSPDHLSSQQLNTFNGNQELDFEVTTHFTVACVRIIKQNILRQPKALKSPHKLHSDKLVHFSGHQSPILTVISLSESQLLTLDLS